MGRGLVGTGVFLFSRRPLDDGSWAARPWVCLLGVPLWPLPAARFRGPASGSGVWGAEREGPAEARPGDAVRVVAGTAAALFVGLGPAWVAWRAIHETGLLEAVRVVAGVGAPVLVALWRDLTVPRLLRR